VKLITSAESKSKSDANGANASPNTSTESVNAENPTNHSARLVPNSVNLSFPYYLSIKKFGLASSKAAINTVSLTFVSFHS
jgi:hypothetical protein